MDVEEVNIEDLNTEKVDKTSDQVHNDDGVVIIEEYDDTKVEESIQEELDLDKLSKEQLVEISNDYFEDGTACLEEEQLEDACQQFSRCLEIKVKLYGELGPECAETYYKYAESLLKKSIKQSAVFSLKMDKKELADATDDLELAWGIFETARIIYEKEKNVEMLTKVHSKLAVVSMESDNFEQAIKDFNKTLELYDEMKVAKNDRKRAEVHCNISLAALFLEQSLPAMKHYAMASEILKSKQQELWGYLHAVISGKKADVVDLEAAAIASALGKEVVELDTIIKDLQERIKGISAEKDKLDQDYTHGLKVKQQAPIEAS